MTNTLSPFQNNNWRSLISQREKSVATQSIQFNWSTVERFPSTKQRSMWRKWCMRNGFNTISGQLRGWAAAQYLFGGKKINRGGVLLWGSTMGNSSNCLPPARQQRRPSTLVWGSGRIRFPVSIRSKHRMGILCGRGACLQLIYSSEQKLGNKIK